MSGTIMFWGLGCRGNWVAQATSFDFYSQSGPFLLWAADQTRGCAQHSPHNPALRIPAVCVGIMCRLYGPLKVLWRGHFEKLRSGLTGVSHWLNTVDAFMSTGDLEPIYI